MQTQVWLKSSTGPQTERGQEKWSSDSEGTVSSVPLHHLQNGFQDMG